MELSFCKYQGTGNDFILIDDRSCFFPSQDVQIIKALCSRNRGIGADGLILLQSSTCADFRMRIFNSDGLEADLCGNGLRCLIMYLKKLGFKEDSFLIETSLETLQCSLVSGEVLVKLPRPKVLHWGVTLSEEVPFELFVVHTGVPHAVVFVDDLDEAPIEKMGPYIRFHPQFAPFGVNVNFVKKAPDGTLRVRTYERGVEGETLSCGTGFAASALVLFQKEAVSSPIRVVSKSGESLEFYIQDSAKGPEIEMRGKASIVFEGRMEFPLN